MRRLLLQGLCAILVIASACSACASPAPTLSPRPATADLLHSARVSTVPRSPAMASPTPTASATASASPTAPGSPTPSGAARIVQSDDGLLTVDVPAGAVADPSVLTASARGEDDLPPELQGLEVRSAFYELTPAGIDFLAPVTITRRVSFDDLALDPAGGLPILVLALRSADGGWKWLTDQALEDAGDVLVVSGQASHTGTVFAFGGPAFTHVDVADGGPTQVGNSMRLSASLTFPDGSLDPPLLGVFDPIVETDFVQIGEAEGPDSQRLSQSFVCTGPGNATVGIRYSVLNVGAQSALFERLGLSPVSTRVTATTPLICVELRPTGSPGF